MSDPVTNVEDVEDVLSSIRRLVTDTSSEKRAKAETAEQKAEVPERPEALILTSNLRINEPDSKPEEDVESTTPQSDLESLRRAVSGDFDDEQPEDDASQSQVAEAEDISAQWSSSAPEEYYEDEPVEPLELTQTSEEPVSEEWPADEGHSDVAETDEFDDSDLADEEVSEAQDQPVEHIHVEDESVETAEIHQFDASLHEDQTNADEVAVVIEMELEDSADEDLEAALNEATDEDLNDDADDINWGETGFSDDSDEEEAEDHVEVAEFEEHSDGHDDVQTVGIASFLRSSSQPREDDKSETETAALDPATMFDDDEEDAPAIDLGDLDEAVIDEDMLRDLVAEIVRQELTGAMGERITRNVRKLVRREIHRAIVAREFD